MAKWWCYAFVWGLSCLPIGVSLVGESQDKETPIGALTGLRLINHTERFWVALACAVFMVLVFRPVVWRYPRNQTPEELIKTPPASRYIGLMYCVATMGCAAYSCPSAPIWMREASMAIPLVMLPALLLIRKTIRSEVAEAQQAIRTRQTMKTSPT